MDNVIDITKDPRFIIRLQSYPDSPCKITVIRRVMQRKRWIENKRKQANIKAANNYKRTS
jgi:hypothetical protein